MADLVRRWDPETERRKSAIGWLRTVVAAEGESDWLQRVLFGDKVHVKQSKRPGRGSVAGIGTLDGTDGLLTWH